MSIIAARMDIPAVCAAASSNNIHMYIPMHVREPSELVPVLIAPF